MTSDLDIYRSAKLLIDQHGEDAAVQQDEGVRRAPRGFSTVEHYPPRYPLGQRCPEVVEIRRLSAKTYC